MNRFSETEQLVGCRAGVDSSKKKVCHAPHGYSAMRGMAIMEFALVLPFLFVLTFGLLECYRSFSHYQVMSVMARELGSAAFRACVIEPDGSATVNCLKDVANRVVPYVNGTNGVLPGTELVMKVYRYNAADPFSPILAGQYRSGAPTSRINDLTIAGDATQRGLHCYGPQKGDIVTTEVFYSQNLSVGFVPRVLYQASIF